MAEVITDFDLDKLITTEFSDCYYIPNPGNAGDSLIAAGTFDYFDSLPIKWEPGPYNKSYTIDDCLVYGGGGNLVGVYHDCENFLNHNRQCKLLLLPHTVTNVDTFLVNCPERLYIGCRESRTYEYVSKFTDNVFLYPDMAYKLQPKLDKKMNMFDEMIIHSRGNFFRTDVEKTDIVLPEDNVDLSSRYQHPLCTGFPARQVTEKLISHVAQYEVIHTNRLHVGIAGQMLGRRVFLYPNSYWKNEEVYNYSMCNDDNVVFVS